ncbi:MAG: oligoribonuclease [Candidatus Dependentiae bacterium]|nr:oligoribonuclease [Candidatus Dependentiae bacterium]
MDKMHANGMAKKCELAKYPLLWIDLEMTGLDAQRDAILEIAVVTTDTSLDCVIEGPSLVIHQPDEVVGRMDQWCYEHHTASGLLESVRQSKITLANAEREIIAFIKRYCDEKRLFFAGNSVYQDRNFLQHYLPTLNALGHYRIIDVSSVKELVRSWYPKDPQANFKKRKHHRALDDIYESIAELAHYRRFFFKARAER